MRDIQRVITVSSWFLSKESLIFSRMNQQKIDNLDDRYQQNLEPLYRAFVLALSVCYHAALYSLETRKEYRKILADSFKTESDMDMDSNDSSSMSNDWILCEILKCQNVFLDEINIRNKNKNIACNLALLENVFMMIVCIELRIPLFIVGKPGSSKSLAKSIVTNAMQGRNSESKLFQQFKEPYFINFQCSPLTTSEMIVKAFEEAAKFQESVDLNEKVSVVNLDEIGLAEGSESMPLKALHPLLEEGTDSDEKALLHQKVGVIGISNWALDPAKMNRGILVSRGEPDINELIESAKGICKYDDSTYACIEPYIGDIAKAYLELCDMAKKFKREFFGLRDYYSLIKMINFFCSKDRTFTWSKLEHSVKRNFNGLEIEILEPFRKYLSSKLDNRILETDPKCSAIDLLESALNSEHTSESTSRYLLFLTENNTAIDIIQNYLINVVKVPTHSLTVIFGSSFRSDQQYTEVCRNISLIKHSMEIGKTIILLNSYNLYESLYDALNQYYYEFGGQKFVDLGLGTHRVKCRVHENFRLIVIAEKAAVYDSKRFPIPLINRLEKHFLNASTMLNSYQLGLVTKIEKWIRIFSERLTFSNGFYRPEPNETFIGYHADTVATLVLYLTEQLENLLSLQQHELDESMEHDDNSLLDEQKESQVIYLAKKFLLRCATPDSIIRISSSKEFKDSTEKEFLWNEYFVNQKHLSLKELLSYHTTSKIKLTRMTSAQADKTASTLSSKLEYNSSNNLIQVSTHSKSSVLNLVSTKFTNNNYIESCVLQSFDTQQQFYSKIRSFFDKKVASQNEKNFLLIQADLNLKYSSDLIACSRHTIVESFKEALIKSNNDKSILMNNFYIVLIINIPKENVKNFIGFQLGYWSCYHLDELEEPQNDLPAFETLKNKPISRLLRDALEVSMNNDDISMEIVPDRSEATKVSKKSNIDLGFLLKKIAHTACSLIVDTNLTRTISRIDLFTQLCDNKIFLHTIVKRLVTLQEQKEEYMPTESKNNWLIKEAANFKTINEYSTLRRACQNYFESRLSPLLGYLLSYIDSYSNLNIIYDSIKNKTRWKLKLWINFLDDTDLCKLDYESMRSKGENPIELRQFMCQSDWIVKSFRDVHDDTNRLNPSLPFFWVLINQLNDLYSNFITSNRISTLNNSFDLNAYAKVISNFFEENQLYKLINQIISQSLSKKIEFNQEILELYISDFLLMKCPVNSRDDLGIIKKIVKSLLSKLDEKYKSDIKYSLPMVHYVFETIKNKFEIYLKFTQFEPKINESDLFKNSNYFSLESQSNFFYIHLDSCIECIENFKRNFKDTSWTDGQSVNKLYALLQLISQLSLGANNLNYNKWLGE
jgi:E3 ubiquitin-protein ligase RNF213